jgi:hypothetical protein
VGLDDKLLDIIAEIQGYPQIVGDERGDITGSEEEQVQRAIDRIKEAYPSATTEEKKTYLSLLEMAIESDKRLQVMAPHGRDDFVSYPNIEDSSLLLAVAESTHPFLPYLKDRKIFDFYTHFIFGADEKEAMVDVAKALPEYFCLLENEKLRKTLKIIWQRYCPTRPKKKEPLSIPKPQKLVLKTLPYLEVLSEKKKRDIFFEVIEALGFILSFTPLQGLVDNLEYINKNKRLFLDLVRINPGPEASNFTTRSGLLVKDPQMLEYFKDPAVRTAFETIERKTNETAQRYYKHSIDDIVSGSTRIVKNLPTLISEGLLDTYLEFTQKAFKRTEMDWFRIAVEASGRPSVLREHSSLYFEILDEISDLSRELNEQYDRRVNMLAIPLMESIQELQDTSTRKRIINTIKRMAYANKTVNGTNESLSACEHVSRLLETLPRDEDVETMLGFINKYRTIFKLTSPGNLFIGAKEYVVASRDNRANAAVIDSLLENAGKSIEEHTLDRMLRTLPTRIRALEKPEQRSRYLDRLGRFENTGLQSDHVTLLLDESDFFEDDDRLNVYLATIQRLGEPIREILLYPTNTEALLRIVRENIEVFRDASALELCSNFLESIKKRGTYVDVAPFLGGVIEHVTVIEPERLQRYLKLISNNLPNAHPDVSRWIQTGLACAAASDQCGEKYFKYRFKEGHIDSKIDELTAMELLLEQASEHPGQRTVSVRDVRYVSSKEQEEDGIRRTARILSFFDQIKKIKRNSRTLEKNKLLMKRKFPEFESCVDNLCELRGDPLVPQTENRNIGTATSIINRAVGYFGGRSFGTDHITKIRRQVDDYCGRYPSPLSLFGNRDQDLQQKKKKVIGFIKRALSPEEAQRVLLEIENNKNLQGSVLEPLRDYTRTTRMQLSNTVEFNQLRIEENSCFVDDLVDEIGACNSGEGSDREAVLIHKLDKDSEGRPNQTLLSINGYQDSVHFDCLGKVLLVEVADQDDYAIGDFEEKPLSKLLVEYVLIAPQLERMRPIKKTERRLLAKMVGKDPEDRIIIKDDEDSFDWREFVFNSIMKYAQREGYGRLIVNTRHKPGGQKCLHEFAKYVADTLNVRQHAYKANLRDLTQFAPLVPLTFGKGKERKRARELVRENIYWRDIDYSYTAKRDYASFELKRANRREDVEGNRERYAQKGYTHCLFKPDIDSKIVESIARAGWKGESYFDAWYDSSGEKAWNDGGGYITGIEIDLEVFKIIERTEN